MAFLNEAFNVADLPASQDFEPVPAGWYSVDIKAADVKQTKSGTGEYIKLQLAITGPTHAGRVVFCNLNVRNANPDAEKIGRAQMGDVMRSTGITRLTDTDQLINKTLSAKLSVKAATADYPASNDVKGFKAAGDAMPKAAFASPPNVAAPKAAGAPPPWAK